MPPLVVLWGLGAGVAVALIASFVGMFYWANQPNFEPLYTNLSPEDGAQVVEKLKEQIQSDLAAIRTILK